LFYEQGDALFTIFDYQGGRRSALALIQAALSRVPLELAEGLTWIDFLPPRAFAPWWRRILSDLVSPFFKSRGIEVRFSAMREGRRIKVTGESLARSARGVPLIKTQATLEEGVGLKAVVLEARGLRRCALRLTDKEKRS